MLYRFSICRKGPPPCGSGRFEEQLQAWLEGCRAAPRQLQGSTAWFRVAAGLAGCRSELQLRKLAILRSCKFGGLGLGWVVLSNALTATANPSPPSLQPRQTHHHSHTAQLLSYSFKPAVPIRPGAQSAQNQNSSSAKLLPFKPTGLQVWWAGVCQHSQDARGSRPSKPQPTTFAARTNSRFQQALPAPLPSLKPPYPTLSLTGTSGEPPRQQ